MTNARSELTLPDEWLKIAERRGTIRLILDGHDGPDAPIGVLGLCRQTLVLLAQAVYFQQSGDEASAEFPTKQTYQRFLDIFFEETLDQAGLHHSANSARKLLDEVYPFLNLPEATHAESIACAELTKSIVNVVADIVGVNARAVSG